jgi:hypothetical protein
MWDLCMQDLFAVLDVLVWVEATIYQLDEDNERMAKQGQVAEHLRILSGV